MNIFLHLRTANRLPLMILRLTSMIVPQSHKTDWRREWNAELWHRHQALLENQNVAAFKPWSLARGMLTDALYLRADRLRSQVESAGRRGSASWCLQMLALSCVASTAVEWSLAGSWRALLAALDSHFFGCFLFVALPAILVAIATSPLRPRKCERKHSRLTGFLSANIRWNLFLAAKVALTLCWSFFLSAVMTITARKLVGHWADWIELLATALAVILSLRRALLDQELRCQHCLRMLSRPTRVGFASRNFLDWNGMELYCADGHGLLHVTEMEGSWCWYDLWVELDPTWHGLFIS